jgi:multimeric flavodoxin WrbA
MAIVSICGGMRPESNTNKLVRAAAEAAGCEVRTVDLGSVTIKPCTGCSHCIMNEGRCVIDDDMQPLYKELLAADGVVIGSPTYYMDVSGAVKCLIDRSLALYYCGIGPLGYPDKPFLGQRPLAEKPVVLVTTVAGVGHEKTLAMLRFCMHECHKMTVVGELAEAVGMNDVDDMPALLNAAAAAGRALGDAVRRRG